METENELTERQKGLFLEDGKPKYLRHFTQLPYLLKILKTGELKLSDTENFKDPKDKEWARLYRQENKKLFALCCTWETELIHHWYAYAGGKFGCYLLFDGKKLIEAAEKQAIKHGLVNYIKYIPATRKTILETVPKEEIPFSKAWTYRCECEYRFVSDTVETLSFNLDTVKQITVTSKMDDDTFTFFKERISKIYTGRISQSTLEKDIEDESENGKIAVR
jgi:hypothetical protein